MIDIHSHVLPFVDDGSASMEASLALIEEAAQAGVTHLFLTPHYMRYRNYLSSPDNNRDIFKKLVEEVKKSKTDIKLHLGNEIYYTIEVINDLRQGKILTMGESKMVLIEFAIDYDEEEIIEAVHNITALGYIPILAHVERYEKLNSVEAFKTVKRMKAKIQVNASAVLGNYGKHAQKLIFALIKNGMVDFVASDIHVLRTNHLAEARTLIQKKFGDKVANSIFINTSILE